MHHPWRAFRALADWRLHWQSLPAGVFGLTNHAERSVILNASLLQVERRCTIEHERQHILRGPVPPDPWLAAREESAVEQAAARALISLEHLGDALAWSLDVHEVADVLWVDVDTLRTRMQHLHPSERAYLLGRVEHHGDA